MSLLTNKRFFPLFVTQFLGAFNDNLFKNALLIFLFFYASQDFGIPRDIMMPLGAGLFILPFMLFSATAGQLADKYPMHLMIRAVKVCEVGIMAMGCVGIAIENIYLMIGALFLMGTQSTFFGPLKYASLPRLVDKKSLIGANAWIEAGTFLSILLGTLAGSLAIALPNGVMVVTVALLIVAIAGVVSGWKVPGLEPANASLKVGLNPISQTARLISEAKRTPTLLFIIMGISWFWFLGATFLSQFPTFAAEVVQGDEQTVALLLALFSVGIGIGSFLCTRWMKGEISALYVPLAAIVLALGSMDLYFSANRFIESGLTGLSALVQTYQGIWVLSDLLVISGAGGVFIVPLYTLLQERSPDANRAQMIAANNIINAAFMVASSLVVMALLAIGVSLQGVFLVIGILSIAVAVLICGLLPRDLTVSIARLFFKTFYKVEVIGEENWPKNGEKAVIVANHVSFLDGPLMVAFGPDALFPINTHIFNKWWGGLSKYFAKMLPIDPTNPYSAKTLIHKVAEGNSLMIFPEGRITVTGTLMKIYPGPATIADRAGAKVVPVRIEGAQFSKFSRLKGVLPLRWFPKITIRVLEPVSLEIPEDVRGRKRREIGAQKLYDIMSDTVYATSANLNNSLYGALFDASKSFGAKQSVVEDHKTISRPIDYATLIKGAKVLGRKVAQFTEAKEAVGVLLPNAVGSVVTFFALQAYQRIPAMLNFSVGAEMMRLACETAGVKTILTSREFIRLAKLDGAIAMLEQQYKIVYLDDIKAELSLIDKLKGLSHRFDRSAVNPDDPAVILFTSGSEGTPKGVVLSHRNILANIAQIGARIDFSPRDIFFNALPIFHSFGMTGGMLLPVLSGLKTFMYPSPLHYRIIPELVYDINATVVFGTDTFLANYGKRADPYDFYSVRYFVAGAEKVKRETRELYMEKFGKSILEGYGATECSPVLAVNTPMHFKMGSVGRLMPQLQHKLEPVPGVEEGGRLWVKGPNVMLGYYRVDNPQVLDAPEDGWYDTGDIVTVDEQGFVTIQGRAKRFIKTGGEMVSLTAVEQLVSDLWPGFVHAAVGRPDPKKGEQLVLVTEYAEADRKALLASVQERNLSELMCPKAIILVKKMPLLGTGKLDYTSIAELALGG